MAMHPLRYAVPSIPFSFELLQGELIEGDHRPTIRFRLPDRRGMDPDVPEVYEVPAMHTVELDGRTVHVGWWAVHGWPRVAAWAG